MEWPKAERLIYACGATLVIAFCAVFLFTVSDPKMCMILMFILMRFNGDLQVEFRDFLDFLSHCMKIQSEKLRLQSYQLFQMIPNCCYFATIFGPYETAIFDFTEFIFPITLHDSCNHLWITFSDAEKLSALTLLSELLFSE